MYTILSISCSIPAKSKSHLPRKVSSKKGHYLLYTEDSEAWQKTWRKNARVKRNWAELFPLIFWRQQLLQMLAGNKRYGLQKIARMFFRHYKRQNTGLNKPLPSSHTVFLKNLTIMHYSTLAKHKVWKKGVRNNLKLFAIHFGHNKVIIATEWSNCGIEHNSNDS